MKEAFRRHLGRLLYWPGGLCSDDAVRRERIPQLKVQLVTCGRGAGADWQARDPEFSDSGASYKAFFRGRLEGRVRLHCGGAQNVRNSLLALAAGSYLGFEFGKLAAGLWNFAGVKRRMDKLGSACGIVFVDDYGHHLTEIRYVDAARVSAGGWSRFQPHQPHLAPIRFGSFGGAARSTWRWLRGGREARRVDSARSSASPEERRPPEFRGVLRP